MRLRQICNHTVLHVLHPGPLDGPQYHGVQARDRQQEPDFNYLGYSALLSAAPSGVAYQSRCKANLAEEGHLDESWASKAIVAIAAIPQCSCRRT
jgi:hypothetical protein